MVHVTDDRPDPSPGQRSDPSARAETPAPSGVRRSLAGATRGLRAAGRGARVAGRGAGTAGHYAGAQARRAARAEGAGDSGLSRLIGLHALAGLAHHYVLRDNTALRMMPGKRGNLQ